MVSQKIMRTVFCISAAVLCFCYCTCGGADRNEIEVPSIASQTIAPKVTVSVTNDGSGLSLVFVLRNDGVSELSFNRSDLPWFPNEHTSLLLVAVDQPDRPIGPTLDWVSLLPGRVTIPPGGMMSGTVNLKRRFHRIGRLLKQGEVMLFWAYKPKVIEGKSLEWTGGLLMLKSKP